VGNVDTSAAYSAELSKYSPIITSVTLSLTSLKERQRTLPLVNNDMGDVLIDGAFSSGRFSIAYISKAISLNSFICLEGYVGVAVATPPRR